MLDTIKYHSLLLLKIKYDTFIFYFYLCFDCIKQLIALKQKPKVL